MLHYVYWSGPVTKNTEKLAKKLQLHVSGDLYNIEEKGLPNIILPNTILLFPTYHENRFIPDIKSLLRFIMDNDYQNNIAGIIGSGNTNFGPTFALAGKKAAEKLQVPYLGSAELSGQPHEINYLKTILDSLQ